MAQADPASTDLMPNWKATEQNLEITGAENHPSMKALSVRQPWAWLIVNGYKDIENRDWATKRRGRIWIHAGLHKVTKPEYEQFLEDCRFNRIRNPPGIDEFQTGAL